MNQSASRKRYVIIHGHFYQPPRENPWTERIDRQDSAAPYHDWNERIAYECYTPNTLSRRLAGSGRITKLTNNYESISFNFGPTLISWLEEKHPETYGRILEADLKSTRRFGGHGNAIAQCYNHIIMPLASVRDQETQIRWGIYDFERRFGREPEGIWLPETAINDTTLEILIGFGFRFIVLSPTQAGRVRPLDRSAGWRDVSTGSIETGQPYRCYGRRRRGGRRPSRFIDIFFYDAPLAIDVSFNHLLRNGDRFAERIVEAYERSGDDLVVIATDGEVYGHHEPFADMALSYLIDKAADAHDLELTNFGAYLETHEPSWEVQLKTGEDNEGTAWSCSHGLGRWKENCGCSVGAPPGWDQEWRGPLRDGLNALHEELAGIFDREGRELLKDPWKARNDYIRLIENRTAEEAGALFSVHAPEGLPPEGRSRALGLLESQRHAMLMFTSCGWFFNDISGIESVQLLEYAARAIECAGAEHRDRLKGILLGELVKARSNVHSEGTGADIYRRAKEGATVDARFLVSQYAITTFLFGRSEPHLLFKHTFDATDEFELPQKDLMIKVGSVTITCPVTFDRTRHRYLLVVESGHGFTCFSKRLEEGKSYGELEAELRKLTQGGAGGIRRYAARHFKDPGFTLRSLFPEDRERVLDRLAAERLTTLESAFETLYEENKDLLLLLCVSAVTPPPSLLIPARTVLTKRLVHEVERWERSLSASSLEGIRETIAESALYGIPINKRSVAESFTALIIEKIAVLAETHDPSVGTQLLEFVSLVDELGVTLDENRIQNKIYAAASTMREGSAEAVGSFMKLAERFNFDLDSLNDP
ncbi:MAG: DUF3536 domain-containing protein [bacterium]|nr:MAG: DUF3536 domain-containing protein [bacterium]